MSRILTALVSSIFIILITAGTSRSHSLGYVEKQLAGKGEFFRHFDRPAPDFMLKDIDGNKVLTKSFAGKTIIVFFTKTACSDHCGHIAEIQSMINISPMHDLVQFVMIIADPDRNTANVIRKHATERGIDFSNWTFLTGPLNQPGTIRQLKQAFGHRAGEGVQATKAVTHVIDMAGRWRADFTGVKFQPIDFVVYINALINSGLGITDGHGK